MNRHVKKGWDASKVVAWIGAVLLCFQQFYDLKAKVRADGQARAADSLKVAALVRRVDRIEFGLSDNIGIDRRLEHRMVKLERLGHMERTASSIGAAKSVAGAALPDTARIRSMGPIQVAARAVAAPFRWLWGGLRAAFPPVRRDST